MTFGERWAAAGVLECQRVQYDPRAVAAIAWKAAERRCAPPDPPTRPMTPDEERAALERIGSLWDDAAIAASVARHGDAGSPPG